MFANGFLIALNNETTCNEKTGILIILPLYLLEMILSRIYTSSILKDIKSSPTIDIDKCHIAGGSHFDCQSHIIPDPGEYNLTKDFVFFKHEWGSLFYKHIGKQNRKKAKQICMDEGDFLHLPIPRFPEENEFYKVFFADEDLWLGLSDPKKEGVYQSDQGDEFIRLVPQAVGVEQFYHYHWINASLDVYNDAYGVTMTKTGHWVGINENEMKDSVCVYNIIPSSCSKCLNKTFCRYKDHTRTETECVCPSSRHGDNCEINLCSKCQNGGYCKIDPLSEEVRCICQYPFYGENCELGLIDFYNKCLRNFFIQTILFYL